MAERDCDDLVALCLCWKEHGLYGHFAPSWDAFCLEVLKVEPTWVDRVCAGLQILRARGEQGAVSMTLAEQAAQTVALGQHGGGRCSTILEQDSNRILESAQ